MSISSRERSEVARLNRSERQPVLLIHGLWLLPNSWQRWEELLEQRGFAAMSVDWPGDAESVDAARRNSDALAKLGVREVTAHVETVIAELDRKPMLIGHSFGGLIAQALAGQGHSLATVAIDPAPFKGIRRLPLSVLRATFPVLRNPLNRNRTVPLTSSQFRYGFTNKVDLAEAERLHGEFHVPAPGRPIFQAAAANVSFSKATAVDCHNPERGPLLIISGTADHTVTPSLSRAAFKKQAKNPSPTQLVEIDEAGHSLVFDDRWKEVAAAAADYLASIGSNTHTA